MMWTKELAQHFPFLATRRFQMVVSGLIGALFAILVLDRVFPPNLGANRDYAYLAKDRNGEVLSAVSAEGGVWRFRIDAEDVDPAFIDRLLTIEDKRFYSHSGVDALALARAFRQAVLNGEIVSGASTITMQTVRLLHPRPRTFSSKIIESIRAIQLDTRLSKAEILSLYLSLAPYGGNIEGIRAASLIYFGKEPSRLSLSEQALLLALPQSPERRRPDRNALNAELARNKILRILSARGHLTKQNLELAISAPLPVGRVSFPNLAYTFAANRRQNVRKPEQDVVLTMEARLQGQLEDLALAYAENLSPDENLSILITKVATGDVVAGIGSATRTRPGGWMDLSEAVRSPGSTLKPFIYGLAIEEGIAQEDTLIADRPTSFGGYRPGNFSGAYKGELRLREALQHSLNVPAVGLLNDLGADRFAGMLDAAGIDLHNRERRASSASLAIALGGTGVSLRDVAALYLGLARGGHVVPLAFEKDNQKPQSSGVEGFRLMDKGVAERVTDVLQGTPSLEGRVPARLTKSAPLIAYKTGTSFDYRDAWSAGYTDDYVVAVWVGRPDGTSMGDINNAPATGRSVAAPLMFRAFDLIYSDHGIGPRRVGLDKVATRSATKTTRRKDRLSFVFPEPGSELVIFNEGLESHPVRLSSQGGVGEHTWYRDGFLLPQDPISGLTFWQPKEPGVYRLTVQDASGDMVEQFVRVRLK
ncbi:MAG: penicillin-binding protein 1C [Pseudomonadota bacterium]